MGWLDSLQSDWQVRLGADGLKPSKCLERRLLDCGFLLFITVKVKGCQPSRMHLDREFTLDVVAQFKRSHDFKRNEYEQP
jgi:hypothetical protein